jgi:biopolymer transport protein ExbB/TolQ
MENLGPLKYLALSGGEWVIYLLLACSVLAVAVIIDRALALAREKKAFGLLNEKVGLRIEEGDLDGAAKAANAAPGAAAAILLAGLRHVRAGLASVEEHLDAARLRERRRLEQRLLILGTLGNNAPFIGLFGTVLGVIKAFHDLSASAGAGPEVVMQGLSEALVATAVGLLVAIPAVLAFNYFQKRVNDLLVDTESLARLLLAHLKDEARAEERRPR